MSALLAGAVALLATVGAPSARAIMAGDETALPADSPSNRLDPLGGLIKAWKGASAHRVNGILGRTGPLWQEDYWDRYIRDEEHFRKAKRYVESNPVKAGLARLAAEWRWSSANAQWRWDGPSRYYGARLIHGSAPNPGARTFLSAET